MVASGHIATCCSLVYDLVCIIRRHAWPCLSMFPPKCPFLCGDLIPIYYMVPWTQSVHSARHCDQFSSSVVFAGLVVVTSTPADTQIDHAMSVAVVCIPMQMCASAMQPKNYIRLTDLFRDYPDEPVPER